MIAVLITIDVADELATWMLPAGIGLMLKVPGRTYRFFQHTCPDCELPAMPEQFNEPDGRPIAEIRSFTSLSEAEAWAHSDARQWVAMHVVEPVGGIN